MKGKTVRKLLKKKSNSSSSSSSSSAGKPLIRKIEDGEDMMPPPPPPTSEANPFDEQQQVVELWKLPEPEIGEDLCDQHEPLYLQKPQEPEPQEPIAIVGNVMLVPSSTEKEASPMSPISTAPTEPATPEVALSPEVMKIPSIAIYSAVTQDSPILSTPSTVTDAAQVDPKQEEETSDALPLWNQFEIHPLQKQLFAGFHSSDWKDPISKCKTLCNTGGGDASESVAETRSLFDATIVDDEAEERPSTAPLQERRSMNEESFDIPPLPQLSEAVVNEERPFDEYPEDERDQEARAFFNELEGEEDRTSVFLSTANSVVESVKTAANTVSQGTVAESVKSAAETMVVQTAETVAAQTSNFDGFFENPTSVPTDSMDAEDGSEHGSQDSPVAREPQSGFDHMVEQFLGSEAFSKFSERIPHVCRELVTNTQTAAEEKTAINPELSLP